LVDLIPARIFHDAGHPAGYGVPIPATTCRLCGAETAAGVSWQAWVKPTFCDHDKLHPGAAICAACLFCVDDHNTVLQCRTGRDKPQRMRNYSHVVDRDGTWTPFMKNEKRAIAAALLADPCAAVISLSGQKHLLFRARPGWWQIEEQAMRPELALLGHLLPHVEALYTDGATKSEIASGHYQAWTLQRLGLAAWRQSDRPIAARRGTLVCQLAIWLAQKQEKITDGDGADLLDGAAARGATVAGIGP
jgi:hypothetical protein